MFIVPRVRTQLLTQFLSSHSVTRCRGWWLLCLQGYSYFIFRDHRGNNMLKQIPRLLKTLQSVFSLSSVIYMHLHAIALKLQITCKKSLCFESHILERTLKNFVDNCAHANSVHPYLLEQREEHRRVSANQQNWATHNWSPENICQFTYML